MSPSTRSLVQTAADELRTALDRLRPVPGRPNVEKALRELESLDGVEGESRVERIRDGVRETFGEA